MFENRVVQMEARNTAQQYATFWCVKFGENATITRGNLQQDSGGGVMSRAGACRWHEMFSESRTVVEEKQRSARPSATPTGDNSARVRERVRSDRR